MASPGNQHCAKLYRHTFVPYGLSLKPSREKLQFLLEPSNEIKPTLKLFAQLYLPLSSIIISIVFTNVMSCHA